MKTSAIFAFFGLTLLCTPDAYADTFGSGSNTFDIEFVTIGNPGNVADTTGDPNPVGSVAGTYRIGKFEISEDMINKANTLGSLGITHHGRGVNKPATSISWFEAAQFVSWLNTSTGATPAYKFDSEGNFQLWEPGDAGYDPNNLYRNSLATYFLPSVDEWYKAAYYDPADGIYYDYPTGSDTEPTPVISGTAAGTAVHGLAVTNDPADITLAGGLSPYGTMGQGGNAIEWEETDFDLMNDSILPEPSSARGFRGAAWYTNPIGMTGAVRGGFNPSLPTLSFGFRVASIPEPSTLLLGVLGALGLLVLRRSLR